MSEYLIAECDVCGKLGEFVNNPDENAHFSYMHCFRPHLHQPSGWSYEDDKLVCSQRCQGQVIVEKGQRLMSSPQPQEAKPRLGLSEILNRFRGGRP